MTNRFNIRVYGLLINERNEVLICDENRFGRKFTKFPGGGLEWGEGTKETVQREWKEELGIDIKPEGLFYVNDFFQESAFRNQDQIISFYFLVSTKNELKGIQCSNAPYFSEEVQESFRWIQISSIDELTFTFPIDKKVGELLKER